MTSTQVLENINPGKGDFNLTKMSPSELAFTGKERMEWVLETQTNYMNAMYRKDVGWISFLWGSTGKAPSFAHSKGIAGIIARRDWLKKQGKTSDASGKDFVFDLVEAVAKGSIRRETGPLGFKRIEMKYKGIVADLLWHRGRRTFYLTGWDDLTGGLKDILESADDFMPGWAKAIVNAEDMDEVSNLFKVLFKVPTDEKASPYFKATKRSIVMPIDKLVAREAVNPKSLENAHSRMKKAVSGEGEKRKPLSVFAMGNGKYKVLDGNTTLQALKDLGEGKAIVEIKKTLLQPGVKTINDLYSQAEEAVPFFKAFMEKWAGKTGGKVSIRPGLKDKGRVLVKAEEDKYQRVSTVKDILAGTLIFDTVQEVSAALRMIEADPSVYRIKNRYENPLKEGYRDILMNIVMPNGHVCELQLNTQTMIDVKETGVGHKIYEILRQLGPIVGKATGETLLVARGAFEELADISKKAYNDAAARSSSHSRAKSSASALASDSEISQDLNRILSVLSGSESLHHFDLSLPPIENTSNDSLSIAKGLSSYSTKSNAIGSSPPFNENIENSEQNVNLNAIDIKGKTSRAFLADNTSVNVMYAVIDIAKVKPSHTDDLHKNDTYPQEIQPRQRDRGAMIAQVEEMAKTLNPWKMGESVLASTGAPIVGPDMAVESGNGRTIALRKAYTGSKGKEYKQWLIENANDFGIDPAEIESIEKPILIRLRTSSVKDRAAFAQTANKDETAGMSPMEMAKVDAQIISDADMALFNPADDGNIAAKSNRDFITRFVSKLGIAESAGYLTADGRATKRLVDRIQAAVVEKAYHDDHLLEMVAEEPDPELRNILTALTFAAGEFAKAKAIDKNLGGIDIPSHAIAAGKLVRRAREESMTLNEILGQLGLFESIPEDTKGVAKFIDENIRRGKRMSLIFRESARYLKEYLLNKEQDNLFGDEGTSTLSPSEIIGRALNKLDGEVANGRSEKQRSGNLFEAARDYEEVHREGEPGGHRGRGPGFMSGGMEGAEGILEGADSMIGKPPFTHYNFKATSYNAGIMTPRVGQKFSDEEISQVEAWLEPHGFSVAGRPTRIHVIGDSEKRINIPDGFEYARQKKREQKKAEEDKQYEERKMQRQKEYDSLPSKPWIEEIFGHDFDNIANKLALARYLDGVEKKFKGITSWKWKDGITKLGIDLETADFSAIKAKYEEAQIPYSDTEEQKEPLKVGETRGVSGVPSTLVKTLDADDGVRYELFQGASQEEKRSAVVVTDIDSGNVVEVKQFPDFGLAEKEYNKAVKIAQGSEPKEPWEMTVLDFYESRKTGPFPLDPIEAKSIHREEVEYALSKGKPVSAEVLKDYPDILTQIKEELIAYIRNYPDFVFEDSKGSENTRKEIRKFLEGISPEKVKALKLGSHNEYLEVLKIIVEKMFPEGAEYAFRKTVDGSETDYDHFLKDKTRKDYIHTIGNTLENKDIAIELKEDDKEKEFFIKKYFNEDIQRDIWDIVVVHDKEIRTKIARKGRNAQRYVEGQVLKVRPDHEASRSGTFGGNTEIASTHNEVTPNNIPANSSDVKIDTIDWRLEMLNASSFADIEAVFRKVFKMDITS